ncbi:hypothetical protein PoB_002096100 [Plakobranchus ocellatus]|uniref:Uncharacterized protein n=1 Tax=Plakobranchus ocellatus TaxID=259542 RepID=A0AAV3ZEX1_9GAST|nr:hypothetical protein PoB_002096100 [Plakobranchus ocellatus]
MLQSNRGCEVPFYISGRERCSPGQGAACMSDTAVHVRMGMATSSGPQTRWISALMCVDYRALNNINRKGVFPLPRIEECVVALDGNLQTECYLGVLASSTR